MEHMKLNNMSNTLPSELLELQSLYNEVFTKNYAELYSELMEQLGCTIPKEQINHFQRAWDNFIEANENLVNSNVSKEDLVAEFIGFLLTKINFATLNTNAQITKDFLLKLANVLCKYGGYRTIIDKPFRYPCYEFWKKYLEISNENKHLEFMQKIINEIAKIKNDNKKEQIEKLLQKAGEILRFFFHVANYGDASEIKKLEIATDILLNLCIENKYQLDCESVCHVPLNDILMTINSKEIQELIFRYLMEYTNYFSDLQSKGSTFITRILGSELGRSEVFRMYLKAALLLGKSDLYSGDMLCKFSTKLFSENAKISNDETSSPFYGDYSDAFSETLLVIGEICSESKYLELLLDSDFFAQIKAMYNFFIRDLSERKYKDEITVMKRRFAYLCLIVKSHQLKSSKIEQHPHQRKRYYRRKQN